MIHTRSFLWGIILCAIFVLLGFMLLQKSHTEYLVISPTGMKDHKQEQEQNESVDESVVLDDVLQDFSRFFVADFEKSIVVSEASDKEQSSHASWWVSSGAYFLTGEGRAHTVTEDLQEEDARFQHYRTTRPEATANGTRPQNIFRLVQRDTWQNFTQQNYFTIQYYEETGYEERKASNGILHFNRYIDTNNLYYSGLRVDGKMIVKKKKDGIYYTLTEQQFLPGVYNRATRPNLLPLNTWIGLKTEVANTREGKVSIKVYADVDKTGTWTYIGEAIDDGVSYGGSAFLEAGHAGIRTDFMDVEFSDYIIGELLAS